MAAVAERVGPRAPVVHAGVRRAGSAPDQATAFAVGQGVNVRRHLEALRDFSRAEFGTGVARPSEGHVQAVNDLLARLRRPLESAVLEVEAAGSVPHGADLGELLRLKSQAHDWVRATERVWDFYFELFGQRQGAFGDWLYACDKIALDCYQHVHISLGVALAVA